MGLFVQNGVSQVWKSFRIRSLEFLRNRTLNAGGPGQTRTRRPAPRVHQGLGLFVQNGGLRFRTILESARCGFCETEPIQREVREKHLAWINWMNKIKTCSGRLGMGLRADEALSRQLVQTIKAPRLVVCSPDEGEQTEAASASLRSRETSPAKVCRGALGFRARQTRPQNYSVVKERVAATPSQVRPKSKRSKANKTAYPHRE